jgi:SynChlorMet cassette protein ScmC
MTRTGYSLKLYNGSKWLIISTLSRRFWVERFATILGLKINEQARLSKYRRMFFLPKDSLKVHLKGDLPKNGWEARDLRSLRLWSHHTVQDIIYEIGNEGNDVLDIMRMWESLSIVYSEAQDSGGLLLHGGLLERDGKGVLLLGQAGAGKSTSCRRLSLPWRALSDDQSLVVSDSKNYLAHPMPTWSEYLTNQSERRWNVEHSVQLAAIFFIEKARIDQVLPLARERAAIYINSSATTAGYSMRWNLSNEEERRLKRKVFENSCQLAKTIPTYILRASLTGRFWEEMEKVL